MPFDTPFRLGPFTVGADGRLDQVSPANFPGFRVAWRGRSLSVRLVRQPSDAAPGLLGLRTVAGRVPSTAGTAPMPRPGAFALLHALPPLLPRDWRVTLLPDHRVTLAAELALAFPITATGLITEVALSLLTLAPYFDLLESVGIAATPEPAEADTWPAEATEPDI